MQVIPLSQHSLHDYVEVVGEDARSFLQGQLTCNVDLLSNERSLVGALCNLKGRVIADFRLLQLDTQKIILQTSAGSGEKIIATLQRYAVFSKVALSAAAGPKALFGLISPSAEAAAASLAECFPDLPAAENAVLHHQDFSLVRVPGGSPCYQIWCHTEAAVNTLSRLDVMEETAMLSAWSRAEIIAGIVHVQGAMSEEYTPQLLNYDISGFIDFDKGCYTGQEVVARMFYRGKAKKRMYLLETAELLTIESRLTLANTGEEVGAELLAVASATDSSEKSLALAIVSTELAAQQAELSVSGSDVSVNFAALPYAREDA